MHPPVRLVAIDMDGTLLPTFSQAISERNARALKALQQAGVTLAIATGRRTAYTAPLLEGLGLRADTPLITSNGAVTRMLDGTSLDRSHMSAGVARNLCGLLRTFGSVVFTFDREGRGELVLEDMDAAHGRIALWVEANRNAIEVVNPLENALPDGEDPIQGMVAGTISKMKKAEKALKGSGWAQACECVRTEYPARDLAILDLLPPGISKGWALERLAARLGIDRKETMAIGDNWNDVAMLEWAGQGVVMGNAAMELRTMAKMRGWKQAPANDDDGVAVVLEAAVARDARESRSTALGSEVATLKPGDYLRAAVLALLAASLTAARGAERITLTNGFALECDHHAQVEGHVRLYMSSGETSYIEFRPGEVASVEEFLLRREATPAR